MKQKILGLMMGIFGFGLSAMAQNPIPNASFDDWESLSFKAPTKWMLIGKGLLDSSKTMPNNQGLRLFNDFNSQTISYALQVGLNYPDILTGGFPISGTPTSIKINYNSAYLGSDTATIIVGFTKGIDGVPIILQQFDILPDAPGSGDKQLTIPLTYSHPTLSLSADSGFVYIVSSQGRGKPNGNGSIAIYDLGFVDGTTATTANLDFETWGGFSVMKPKSWYTSTDAFEEKMGKLYDTKKTFTSQSNDARSGSAIVLQAQSTGLSTTGNNWIPAWMITQNTNSPFAAMDMPSFTINQRYESMRGYWKGNLVAGDRVTVIVNFFHTDTLVGSAIFSQNSDVLVPSSYSLFTENVVWDSRFTLIPTKATVGVFLSDSTFTEASNASSKIFLDDLSLETYAAKIPHLAKSAVSVSVYPNPSKGNVNLVSAKTIKHLLVIDRQGKIVYRANHIDALRHAFQLPVNQLGFGVYWIKIEGDDLSETHSIVFQP
ncbi:MAG: T9SS type A sorting domain-containing protein [Flavobacteriaceae bacterium]|nr:T9SS type A sorting domain-containing protein [Flavobacteriaceae bacterium]